MYSGHAMESVSGYVSISLQTWYRTSRYIKTRVLSEVAKLFDFLGLLGRIIVIAKLILQDLWQLAIQWDESVPQDIHTQIAFRTQMGNLNQLKIPRCVKFNVHQPSGSARILRCQPTRVRSLHIPSHQARSQRPSLQVAVLKISCRATQNRFVTAIKTIGALN